MFTNNNDPNIDFLLSVTKSIYGLYEKKWSHNLHSNEVFLWIFMNIY